MILTVEFAQLPMLRGGTVACPVVDLTVNGVDEAPLRCMIDTGAGGVRLPGSTAEALGVDLSDVDPGPPHIIGGTETHLYDAEVSLACAGFEWQATVSFCTPDFAGFGLAGLRGFFDKIYVGLDGDLQVVELEPHDDRLRRLGLDSTGRRLR
jgi:hypothetical protein